MNCHSYCLEITGQISQSELKKYIDNVNIFHNGGETVLLISVQTTFELNFENSVVLSNSNALLENQNANVKPIFNNCIVNEKYDQNKAQFNECQFVDNSIDYLTIHPHFTYKDVCIGPHLEKKTQMLLDVVLEIVSIICVIKQLAFQVVLFLIQLSFI